MLCALILYRLRDLQLNDRFLGNFFVAVLFTLRAFARNLLRGNHRRNIFFFQISFWCLTCDTKKGFTLPTRLPRLQINLLNCFFNRKIPRNIYFHNFIFRTATVCLITGKKPHGKEKKNYLNLLLSEQWIPRGIILLLKHNFHKES